MREKPSFLTICAAAFVLGILFSGILWIILNKEKKDGIILTTALPPSDFQFSIYGAVNDPGTYSSPEEVRLGTAVAIAGGYTENADIPLARLSNRVRDGESIFIPTMGTAPTEVPETRKRLDLNTASREELITLPGIGEKKAGDILALREKLGGFRRVEDLLQIQGIGETILEKFYDLVTVNGSEE